MLNRSECYDNQRLAVCRALELLDPCPRGTPGGVAVPSTNTSRNKVPTSFFSESCRKDGAGKGADRPVVAEMEELVRADEGFEYF